MKTIKKIFNCFGKDQTEKQLNLLIKHHQNATFILMLDKIKVGFLHFKDDQWQFEYTKEFRDLSDMYNPIVGFPDLNKTYVSEELWPFFQIRKPGLNQPLIQEILKKEKINEDDDVQLLKRFGKKSISNPFELIPC